MAVLITSVVCNFCVVVFTIVAICFFIKHRDD